MNRGFRRFCALAAGVFSVLSALVVYTVVVTFGQRDFYLKRSFLLPQPQLLLIGAGGIALLCAALGMLLRWGKTLGHAQGWRAWAPSCAFWLLLLAFQAFVSYHAYFLCDWDAGNILESAYNMAAYGDYINHAYFSMYPNNVLLAECFAALMALFRAVAGDAGYDRCVLILILVQCVLNTATCMLCSWAAERMSGSRAFAAAVGVVCVLLVGFSPWTMVPYSDGMALVIPMAVFCLYLLRQELRWRWICWYGIGALTALGYMLKPQAAIMGMAIVLLETARMLLQHRWKPWKREMGCLLLALLVVLGPMQSAVKSRSLIEVDEEQNIGALHFVMMGLNRETSGTYSFDDQMISTTAEGVKQRGSVQRAEIARRVSEMGVGGLLELMQEKTLINFGDGTFAWGINGVFFHTMIEDKDEVFSPLFKDILYTSGKLYKPFSTMLQAVWLGVLGGCVLALLALRRADERQGNALCVLCIALVGLMVFEWLFEAKARYLYLYAPQFVLLGVGGIWALCVRRK